MIISRRNFLGAVSASVMTGITLSGSVQGTAGKAAARTGMTIDGLSQLSWRSFYPYVYTDFDFGSVQRRGRIESTRLTLSAMSATENLNGLRGREPRSFVLTFKNPAESDGRMLSQGTYSVQHFALGNFDLFISDANPVDGEYIYTAVINRLTE